MANETPEELALKQLAESDAANHTTLLVRRSGKELSATLVRGNGRYSGVVTAASAEALADVVKNMIIEEAARNTGSFVMGIDLVAQGTVGPHGPGGGGGPGGDDWLPVLQSSAIDVHMQVRGLAEKVQLASQAQLMQQAQLKK